LEQSQSILVTNKKGLKFCQSQSLIVKKTSHEAEITLCYTLYVQKTG